MSSSNQLSSDDQRRVRMFALVAAGLAVAHVIVMGHSSCGGVKGCLDMCSGRAPRSRDGERSVTARVFPLRMAVTGAAAVAVAALPIPDDVPAPVLVLLALAAVASIQRTIAQI